VATPKSTPPSGPPTDPSSPAETDGFAAALARVAGVQGWTTDAQARRLWDSAHRLSAGAQILEIGSYHGRSAIILASAAPDATCVVAIDPHAGNDRGPQQIHGSDEEGEADNRAFRDNLARSGVADRVRHIRRPSGEALDRVDGDIDLLYIDGAHRYRFAREDVRQWGARVAPGGTLFVHDAFSSIGVTGALARCLFFDRGFRYIGRERSLAEYRRTDLFGRVRVRNALRQAMELRWFIRNVVLKVAIAAHLRPLRRLLDPHDEGWPY
jgi:predicted O-methyltransferase YrrM